MRQRTFLVDPHQTAITRDIRRQNRRQSPLDAFAHDGPRLGNDCDRPVRPANDILPASLRSVDCGSWPSTDRAAWRHRAAYICGTAAVTSCTITIGEVFLFGSSADVGETLVENASRSRC